MPLSWHLGTLTSWNPLGHSRLVTGLLYPFLLADIWAVRLGRNVKYSVGMLLTADERSELFYVSDLCLTSVSFVLPPNFKTLRTFPSNYLWYLSSSPFSSCSLSLSCDTALSDLLQAMSSFRCNFLDFRLADVIGISAIKWVLFAFQFLILLCFWVIKVISLATKLLIPTHAHQKHLKNSNMFRSTTIIRELQCPCQSYYYMNTVVCMLSVVVWKHIVWYAATPPHHA